MKLPIAIAAVTALFSTSAFAADMAVKAPPPPQPSPAYAWTGFYVGVNAGYGWHDPTVSVTPNDIVTFNDTCLATSCISPTSFDIRGALGGVQAGYNWQINQNWLLGFETDFDWSDIKGTGTSNFLMFSSSFPSTFRASEDVKWFGTVRGRVGFLPWNNFLVYGTGGVAYGRVNSQAAINSPIPSTADFPLGISAVCTFPGGAGATNCFLGNSSRIATGFTVGAGGEYRLWNNISLKAEYLYVNLGHGNAINVAAQATFPGTTPSSFTASYSRVDFNVIRAGLNWKLN